MAIVHIRINNRDYDIACDDGQEEHLRLLADEVDDRIRSLIFGMGANPGEGMALLLTALTLTDELFESKKEVQKIASEVRQLTGLVDDDKKMAQESRMMEIEAAMAVTLEEIAMRIEKIAQQIEIN